MTEFGSIAKPQRKDLPRPTRAAGPDPEGVTDGRVLALIRHFLGFSCL
jgi:hypothetical protein